MAAFWCQPHTAAWIPKPKVQPEPVTPGFASASTVAAMLLAETPLVITGTVDFGVTM